TRSRSARHSTPWAIRAGGSSNGSSAVTRATARSARPSTLRPARSPAASPAVSRKFVPSSWKERGLPRVLKSEMNFDEEQIGSLGERAIKLAADGAEAYRHALDALADDAAHDKQDRRDWALGQAVAAAAEPALALVRLATDLVDLCGEAVGRVEPRVQADVVA